MKEIIIAILSILLFSLIASGLVGGFMYYWFPRPDMTGDNSILNTCKELGGTPMWGKWQGGTCDGKECYLETCVIGND